MFTQAGAETVTVAGWGSDMFQSAKGNTFAQAGEVACVKQAGEAVVSGKWLLLLDREVKWLLFHACW